MEREKRGTSMPSTLMIFKKTTAISSEQSLLHLIFTGFEGMSRRHQNSQPISVPCTEQSSGHLGPEGGYIRGSFRGKRRKYEKPTALDLILVVRLVPCVP